MAVEQTRIYELGLYLEDLDPDEVMVGLDHPSWSRPKRFPLSALGGAGLKSSTIGFHIERGRLTGLTNHYVTEDFDEAFNNIPVGRENLHVYRVTDLGGGQTVDELVPIYGLDVTTTGFSFYIRAEESLTGVIVEYLFI